MRQRALFFRLTSATAALAFLGLYAQLPALTGRTGLEPAHATLERRRVPGDVLDSIAGLPSFAWLLEAAGLPGDAAADALALGGAALALTIAAGPAAAACAPSLATLAMAWVSLLNLLPPHLEHPGDGLLAEALWAGAAAAPLVLADRPLDAPAYLLRWVAAKAAFLGGRAALEPARAAWLGGRGGFAPALAAVVGVAAAPLALVPSPGARAAAAAALAARALAARAGWASALQAVLCLPLVWGGGGGRRRNSGLAAATAAAATLTYVLPALAAGAQLLSPSGGADTAAGAVDAALARATPWAVGAAAAGLAALAARDLWRAVGPGGPPAPPPPGGRGGRAASPPHPPPPSGAAAPWATLIAGACLLVLSAGAADVLAPAAGGVRGCSACGGRAGARLALRRAHYALRPWRAAGGGSGGLGGGGGGAAEGGVIIEGAAHCGPEDEEPTGWTRLAPPLPPLAPAPAAARLWAWWAADPPRLASGLAARAPPVRVGGPGGGDGGGEASPPAWVDHLAHRLVNGGGGGGGHADGGGGDDPVWAAATGAAGGRARPCAVRVVSATASPPLTLLPPTRPGDGDQAIRLAAAGRGPLVDGQFPRPTAAQRAAGAALGGPRAGGWAVVGVVGVAVVGAAAAAARAAATLTASTHAKRE